MGGSLRNDDANGGLCALQHTKLPRRLLTQSQGSQHAYDPGKSRERLAAKRGMFTEMLRHRRGEFYSDLGIVGKGDTGCQIAHRRMNGSASWINCSLWKVQIEI
jgi:hypothetical protein